MSNNTVVFSLFGMEKYREALCAAKRHESGIIDIHIFPDKETLVKIETDLRNKSVIFIVSTDRPNEKIMPILQAVETARSLGAKNMGLIAPYLAYMRQDIAFHEGEGVSSQYFASLLSTYFDWVITVDPHLHRWHSLDQLFNIPAKVLHADRLIAEWIKQQVAKPLLIGPDMESSQWVEAIAKTSQAPYLIVEKTRFSDTKVSATLPKLEQYPDHTPVLMDDIISTGKTMIETIRHIQAYGIRSITCVAVHAVFADQAYEDLMKTGISELATCNTIIHPSNKIDVSSLVIDAV